MWLLAKIFLTSKFSYSAFSNPTHKRKLRRLQGTQTHTVERRSVVARVVVFLGC
jgi:hypothetical protein